MGLAPRAHCLCSFPGAVDEMGSMPFYAEECASMLAVTFSGGDKMMRSIVSTTSPLCPARLAWLQGSNSPGQTRDKALCLLSATQRP